MPAPHSELPALLSKIDALIEADKYKEVAETFAAFVKEHPTTSYLAAEPVPFKLNVRFSKKHGSSATTTFTLRHTTWALGRDGGAAGRPGRLRGAGRQVRGRPRRDRQDGEEGRLSAPAPTT